MAPRNFSYDDEEGCMKYIRIHDHGGGGAGEIIVHQTF